MNIEKPEQISLLISRRIPWNAPSDRQQKTKCLSSEAFIPPPLLSASLSPLLLMEKLSTQLRFLFQLQCFSLVTPVWAAYFCISSQVVHLFCQFKTGYITKEMFKLIYYENIGATRKGVACSGVFISHLQSIGPKLGLNFVWNDCIMGSLERLEFDWNGKQCLHTQNTSRLIWLWRTAGEEGNGIWSDGRYWGETQTKLNSASEGEEEESAREKKKKRQWSERNLQSANKRKITCRPPFVVGVTSYWYCISWSQGFCSRTVCLYLTDKIDPCHS